MSTDDTALDPVLSGLVDALATVAPDVVDEVRTIDPDLDLFEEFGLDSMDRLTIMERLASSTGRQIPEDRYPELTSLAAMRSFLT